MIQKLIFFVLIIVSLKTVFGQPEEVDELSDDWNPNEIIPKNYNRERAPVDPKKKQAVDVDVYVSLLSILPNGRSTVLFDVDVFLHQYWRDYRLQKPAKVKDGEKITLTSRWKDRLWTPDIYFRNAISGGVSNVLSQSVYFNIINGTNVFMAARMHMTLLCEDMNFRNYPLDTQICTMRIGTLAEDVKTVLLTWRAKGFKVASTIRMPEYHISDQVTVEDCRKDMGIGKYSCLKAHIKLTRHPGRFIIKRFIPSFLIVMMTFVGFWLPTNVYPARVSLIITALLALITQQIQSELSVSYIYALEVWMVGCITFVFAGLFEYAIAISWIEFKKNEDEKERQVKTVSAMTKLVNKIPGPKNTNNIIDLHARLLFPAAFLTFVTVYLSVYLSLS